MKQRHDETAKVEAMKYATLMTTGLLANISIFASDMPATEPYADLMRNKQRVIRQLDKQIACVRLANDDQTLRTCLSNLTPIVVRSEEKTLNKQKMKTDALRQHEFF